MPLRRTIVLSLFALLVAATCRQPESQPAASPKPATLTDDLGRLIARPPHIARIVTLAPNLTEMVYALGSGAKLVGTDDFSDFPAEAKKVAKVGGMQPNVEMITALHPDLVLATTQGNQPSLAPALAAANVPLFVVRSDRLEQIPKAMARLAELLDSPNRDAVSRLRDALARQRRTRAKRPRILFAVWTNPIYVAGRDNFDDDLLTLCGGENVVAVPGWPQYSLESLVADPPDVILYPNHSVTRAAIDALLQKGVKSEAVAVSESVFTRPGPRVAEAAEALNAILDGLAARQTQHAATDQRPAAIGAQSLPRSSDHSQPTSRAAHPS